MKKRQLLISSILIVLLSGVGLGGCASLQGKWRELFGRKKPIVKSPAADLEKVINYRKTYRNSYILWRACQEELVDKLGMNRKKEVRLRYIIIEHLKTMQSCLKQEKARDIGMALQRFEDMTSKLARRRLTNPEIQQLKRFLSREDRMFQKEFSYQKMQKWIKPSVRYVSPDYLEDDKN